MADKLLTRDRMKSAICELNLEIWPLGRFWLIKRPSRPLALSSALLKRPLRERWPRGRLQHKPIAVAESRAGAMLKLALRNPITGVPRVREAAAQTHSCGKIYLALTKNGSAWPLLSFVGPYEIGRVKIWLLKLPMGKTQERRRGDA